MSWQIHLPDIDRSGSLADVAEAARVLPTDEDRAIARQLVLDEIVGGEVATAGELYDRFRMATRAERRKWVDRARERAGYKSISRLEFEAEFAVVQRNAAARAHSNPTPRWGYNDSGLLVDLAEQEQEAERARIHEETLRHRREAEQAQRDAEAAQLVALEAAQREVLPANVMGPA